jgi:lipid II:glycine glycyltransferase (peptidoglycan interpeptide bridge formation enzyme)
LGDAAEIRVAYARPRLPVAAILTLRFRDTLVYKYGCSDRHFNYLGAMPLLFWRAIQNAKSTGATRFDLGRTEPENAGLLAFKGHWTRQSAPLVYWRFPVANPARALAPGWAPKLTGFLFSHMPSSLLTAAGRLAYPHIG